MPPPPRYVIDIYHRTSFCTDLFHWALRDMTAPYCAMTEGFPYGLMAVFGGGGGGGLQGTASLGALKGQGQ